MFVLRAITKRQSKAIIPLQYQSSTRYFAGTALRLNEEKKVDSEKKIDSEKKVDSESPSRRPLSRVAIGGTNPKQKYASSNSIEFASWKAILLFLGIGGAGSFWFGKERARIKRERELNSKKSHGKPLVGGPFKLTDFNGETFTHENLKNEDGTFSMIYFGFTNCPDVCPEELEKLGDIIEELKKDNISLQSIFITCDPARDKPDIMKKYLMDFHPSIIGLTGSYEAVKSTCKKFRVYFSTPPDVKPGQDYLVDHSIFFYLMDNQGNFVDVIGREVDGKSGAEKIKAYMNEVNKASGGDDSWFSFLK